MKLFKRIAFLMIILGVISCKKEDKKNTSAPTVFIELPRDGEHYSALDTAIIKGKVTDDTKIARITISLKNEQNIRVLPAVNYFPGTSSYELDVTYLLTDLHLESGNYYFDISAFDEDGNKGTVFKNIRISEVPISRKGIYAIVSNGSGIEIDRVVNNKLEFFKAFNGDYLASSVNSFDQQLYTIGSSTGDLRAVNLGSGELDWTRMAAGGIGTPYFQSMSFQDRNVFYSLYTGEVRGIDNGGVGIYDGKARPGNVARQLLKFQDKVITVEKAITANSYQLIVYELVSGVEAQRMDNVNLPAGMYSLDASSVLIFTNQGSSNQEINKYNVPGNFIEFEKEILTGDSIKAIARVDQWNFIFSKGQSIFRFDANRFETTRIVDGINANNLAFDQVNQEIWAVVDQELRVYHYENGTLLNTIASVNKIEAVHILYNK